MISLPGTSVNTELTIGEAVSGTTPGGGLKHEHYLYQVPMTATINNSTANLDLLAGHDWLGNSGNRVLLTLAEAPYLL